MLVEDERQRTPTGDLAQGAAQARMQKEEVLTDHLRLRRRRLGLSQAQVAERMQAEFGINWIQTTVAKSEAGTRPIGLNEAAAWAAVLGESLNEALLQKSTAQQRLAIVRTELERAHSKHAVEIATAWNTQQVIKELTKEMEELEYQVFSQMSIDELREEIEWIDTRLEVLAIEHEEDLAKQHNRESTLSAPGKSNLVALMRLNRRETTKATERRELLLKFLEGSLERAESQATEGPSDKLERLKWQLEKIYESRKEKDGSAEGEVSNDSDGESDNQ